jgi:hypothetical protein
MQEIDINVTLFLIVSTFLFYLFIFYRCYNYEKVYVFPTKYLLITQIVKGIGDNCWTYAPPAHQAHITNILTYQAGIT